MVTKPEVRRAAATITRRKGDIGVTDASKPSPNASGAMGGNAMAARATEETKERQLCCSKQREERNTLFPPFLLISSLSFVFPISLISPSGRVQGNRRSGAPSST